MDNLEIANTFDLRLKMVSDQIMRRGIDQPAILDAFRTIPRHLFVSGVSPEEAYSDQPLPIRAGQTISQPYIVALMLSYLDMYPQHKILEIGTLNPIDLSYLTFLVFIACASGHIFYNLGKRIGISNTLDYLKADGQIDFDED